MDRRIQVFGPAYLDRVLRVDRPLIDPAAGPPLDQSVDGVWTFGEGLRIVDPNGSALDVSLPDDWPGPTGAVAISRPFHAKSMPATRAVRGLSWHDDLGGMGAGYAAAMGAELVSALGPDDDPTSRAVADRIAREGIAHRPIRVPGHPADWTLLLTSGGFGDKLPIGFRGCHAAIEAFPPEAFAPCRLRVVASFPNALAAKVLRVPGAAVRFFAPAMRNVTDRDCPVSGFAEFVDILSCNRREWESMPDREEVAWRVSILAVTDGPNGSIVRFTTPSGEPGEVKMPAFPRSEPPRDTNRAGEAYASALVSTLIDAGWSPGVAERSLVRLAAARGSTAAALVLDRVEFGFPSPTEIDDTLRAGRVGS